MLDSRTPDEASSPRRSWESADDNRQAKREGNAASIFGGRYPGAGATLGPAMTWDTSAKGSGGEPDRLRQYQAAVCLRDVRPGQNGNRHLPFALRKVAISTAESAMNMMTTIRMVRPPMPEDCAAGTGALRCCRSSSSGQRSMILRTGSPAVAILVFPQARRSSEVKLPLDGAAMRSAVSGFVFASASLVIEACASSGLYLPASPAGRASGSRRAFFSAFSAVCAAGHRNNDFENPGLPSYQHLRPSISR
jgi:hypothetical protein